MLVSTADRLCSLLVTSTAFLGLVLSLCNLPHSHSSGSECYLSIHSLKQDAQQNSRLRNNSHLPKLLAWLTNANTPARAVPCSSTQIRYTSLVSTLHNCVAKQITKTFSNCVSITGKYLTTNCIMWTTCMKLTIIRLVMSVCLSVRMIQLKNGWTYLH
jgi:hypothetical protein